MSAADELASTPSSAASSASAARLDDRGDHRPAGEQRARDRRADEPRGAGDDDAVAGARRSAHDGDGGRAPARRAAHRAPRHRRGRLEEEPAGSVRVGEHVVEGGHDEVDLRLARPSSGGQQLDDVDAVGGDLGEDPVAVEQREHDRLGEERGADALGEAPPPPQPAGRRLAELEADHLALAADVDEQLVALLERREARLPARRPSRGRARRAPRRRVTDERGEPRDHRELVLLERRRVHERAVHRRVDGAEDVVAREHRGDRDVAARERLGRADEVRGRRRTARGTRTSRCARCRSAPRRSRTALRRSRHACSAPRQYVGGCLVDALALDRLGDERRDVAARERGRAARRGRRRGPRSRRRAAVRTRPERRAAVQRQRSEREPVVRVRAVDDARALGERARELDRRLDRLGARVAEVDPLDAPRGCARRAPRRAARATGRSRSAPCSAGRGRWPGAAPP